MTVATGFDVDYYLDQVGVDYYLTAGGEPPGIWAGKGAAALGLRGLVGADKASKETMRALFHYGIGPDGVPLSTRQRAPKYQARAVYAQVEEAIARAHPAALTALWTIMAFAVVIQHGESNGFIYFQF